MELTHSLLFDQVVINKKTLDNRFVVAPMTRTSATPDGIPTSEMMDYYESFALGGYSMIITEGTYTDDIFSKASFNQPGLVNASQMKGWKKIVQKIHGTGAIIICQLMHAGALSHFHNLTIAPSAIQPLSSKQFEKNHESGEYPVPAAMHANDFELIKTGFVNAAILAKQAGFDGVEVHAANGYLFDQFITPYTNHRTDQYGGTVKNRVRFLSEVSLAIRLATGGDFILGIRFSENKVNNLSYRWPGGYTDAEELFSRVNLIRPDYIHIAAEGGNWKRECWYAEGLSSTGIAKSITNIPVIANGGLHDQELSECLVSTRQADLISIGRAAIANPNLPHLIQKGQPAIPFTDALIKPDISLAHAKVVLRALMEKHRDRCAAQ